MTAPKLSVFCGDEPPLFGVDPGNPENRVTGVIGPSRCGKLTRLRRLSRMNDMIVIVTRNMQQAPRVTRQPAFFHLGRLAEAGRSGHDFTSPVDERNKGYTSGRYDRPLPIPEGPQP